MSKFIALATSVILAILSSQAEVVSATFGYLFAAMFLMSSIGAFVLDKRRQ